MVSEREDPDGRRSGNRRYNGRSHSSRHKNKSPDQEATLALRVGHQQEVLVVLDIHAFALGLDPGRDVKGLAEPHHHLVRRLRSHGRL